MTPSNVDTQSYIYLDDVIRQPREIAGYDPGELRPDFADELRLDGLRRTGVDMDV